MASKVINYGLPHMRYTHSGVAEDVIIGFCDVHYLNMTE